MLLRNRREERERGERGGGVTGRAAQRGPDDDGDIYEENSSAGRERTIWRTRSTILIRCDLWLKKKGEEGQYMLMLIGKKALESKTGSTVVLIQTSSAHTYSQQWTH